MSSTTGVQNYLSNVFRPVYTFDPTTSTFTPKLEISNIDIYSGNSISVSTIAVGDSNSNVYVGSNAGNAYNITKNDFNVTAVGYGAASNISNVSNSVYIGWYSGANNVNSQDVIAIGANLAGIGAGSSNIFLGTSTGSVGASNIFIGHYIAPGNVSNQIKIGYRNQIPIAADLSSNWVGLGGVQSPVFPGDNVDISGNTYVLGNVGINTVPGGNGTLDVNGNFNVDDGYGFMRYRTDLSTSTITLSNFTGGSGFLNVTGTTASTNGFYSTRGLVTVPSGGFDIILGPIKKGIITVSAVDQVSSANRAAVMYFAYTNASVTSMVTDITNGTAYINISNSNLKLNTTNVSPSTYDYSITYFPLP